MRGEHPGDEVLRQGEDDVFPVEKWVKLIISQIIIVLEKKFPAEKMSENECSRQKKNKKDE